MIPRTTIYGLITFVWKRMRGVLHWKTGKMILLLRRPLIALERFTSEQSLKYRLVKRNEYGEDIFSFGWTMLFSKRLKQRYAGFFLLYRTVLKIIRTMSVLAKYIKQL